MHALLAAGGIKAAAGDGKVVHGSKRRATIAGAAARPATYLVSIVTHATTCPPVVIAQGEAGMSVDARTSEAVKKGEAAAMRGLLGDVDLPQTVVTVDAGHVYPDTGRAVADAGGYYICRGVRCTQKA